MSEGNCLSISIYLEGSGVSSFMEVPIASAAMVVDAVDGFLSLASIRQNRHSP